MNPRIIDSQQAAEYLGYSKPNEAFVKRCKDLGIKAVWRGRYDLRQIDAALDANIGMVHDETPEDKAVREFFEGVQN